MTVTMTERNYWLIGADGKVYGPSDEATFVRWIAESRVTATTQVATAENGPWQDASTFPELAKHFGIHSEPAGADSPGTAVGGAGQSNDSAGAPSRPASPPREPVSSTQRPAEWPPNNLQVALLVSGILNILAGLGAVAYTGVFALGTMGVGLCCCPIGLAPLIVGVMQCMDYAGAPRMQVRQYLDRSHVWGIINIVCILFGNVFSLICGILQLVWVSEARNRYGTG